MLAWSQRLPAPPVRRKNGAETVEDGSADKEPHFTVMLEARHGKILGSYKSEGPANNHLGMEIEGMTRKEPDANTRSGQAPCKSTVIPRNTFGKKKPKPFPPACHGVENGLVPTEFFRFHIDRAGFVKDTEDRRKRGPW